MLQLIFIAYVLVVITMSLVPEAGTSTVVYKDKIAHIAAYFIMGVLGYVSVNTTGRKLYLLLFIILLGGVLELIQFFVPGRSVSLFDALSNTAGVMLGFLICRFCALYIGWGNFSAGGLNDSSGGEEK